MVLVMMRWDLSQDMRSTAGLVGVVSAGHARPETTASMVLVAMEDSGLHLGQARNMENGMGEAEDSRVGARRTLAVGSSGYRCVRVIVAV